MDEIDEREKGKGKGKGGRKRAVFASQLGM